jgi:YVTN family beta-propeller protein
MKNRLINFFSILTAALILSLFFSSSAWAQSDEYPQFIYVCNQGSASVTVGDASTQDIAETVDVQALGFSANAKPHHAVAEADGSYWYVTLIGENRVLKFNRENEWVGQATLEVPGLLALHPQENLLYVGRSMSAVNPPQSYGVINRSDMSVLDEVDLFFTRPHALTISPDGLWSFVGSLSVNQILSINATDGETNLTTVSGDNHVFVNFAVHPDGSTMVATGQISGQLLVFDISDPMNPTVTDSIKTGAMPWHPVFSPDGNYVYFGNKGDNSVSVVNMENRTVEAVIKGRGLAQPHGSALSLDGNYLFVTNNNLDGTYQPEESSSDKPNGTVVVINTETRSIEKIIEVGNYPSGIGTNAR